MSAIKPSAPMLRQYHVALHLAHRWFAYLEAPGGDLDTHLTMFHPQVQLSGHRGSHTALKTARCMTTTTAAKP